MLPILLVILALSISLPIAQVHAQAKTLKIISPHNEFIRSEFENAFKNWYLASTLGVESVTIEWYDFGGTSADLRYIEASYTTNATDGGIGMDVFFGGGIDPFIKLAGENYLESYKLPDSVLSPIPAELAGLPIYDSQYRWYGAALSGFGIEYNKVVLQQLGLPEPTTWEDLTNPAVKGWVESADPRTSGSTHMAYELMLQGYGWEKGWEIITQIGANIKSFPTSSSAPPKDVSKGDVAYGLVIDFFAWAEIASVGADKVGYVLPEGLTVINPDSIAILKGAPNMDVAQKFVEFVMSEPGQSLWMLPKGAPGGPTTNTLGRMSVLPDLYTKLGANSIVPVNPFALKSTLKYDAKTGSAHYSVINDLFGAMIIDQHDSLVAAWDAINAATQTVGTEAIAEAKAKLGAVPISQSEADDLGKQWSDQTIRNQKISEWRDFAANKYSEVPGIISAAQQAAEEAAQQAAEQAAQQAAQQAQMMYAAAGIVIIIIVVAAAYLFMRRRKEAEAVKK